MKLSEAHIAFAKSEEMHTLRRQVFDTGREILRKYKKKKPAGIFIDVDDTCLDTIEYVEQNIDQPYPIGWDKYCEDWHLAVAIPEALAFVNEAFSNGHHISYVTYRGHSKRFCTFMALRHAGFPTVATDYATTCEVFTGGDKRNVVKFRSLQCFPLLAIDDCMADLESMRGSVKHCMLVPNIIYGTWSRAYDGAEQ